MTRRLVLVGAGHAHLETISRARAFTEHGVEVALVAPDALFYCGTATGELGGSYGAGHGRIDVTSIARRAGVIVCAERATRLATAERTVYLESGSKLAYDWLSLDLGASPRREFIPGLERERVIPARPFSRLAGVRERLLARDAPKLVVVLGGGAAGCEIAANVKACREQTAVVLVDAAPRLFAGTRAGKLLESALLARGVALILGRRVVGAQGDALQLDDQSVVRFDLLINASGAAPSRLNQSSGLLLDERGAVLVDTTLQSVKDPRVFAVGDCATRRGTWPQKNAVHAQREGHVLFENLRRVIDGRAPVHCVWPERTLQILDLGDGSGVALYGSWAHRSRAMLWWKRARDRRWLSRWRAREGASRTP
ncbi:MAG: FAD-dependent oxidoreductase [Planctomycetes bacterium]|nr:FAD-dependent oxidoreductase [Planctomycetota bacterium]